jgi:MFS family permease
MESSSLIQLFSYAAIMASSIFIPLLAQSFGASPALVGLLVGVYNAFYLFSSYLFGLLADKYGGKTILRAGLMISILFFATQMMARDLFSLMIVRALAGAATGIFPAALAVYAYHEYKGKMGLFTGAGSLGWALGAILAGLVSNNQTVFAMSSVFFGIAFFLSLQMKEVPATPHKIKLIPLGLVRRNLRIYLPYFFRALGAQAIWSIFPLYLVWSGADKLWVGIAYFINTFSQFFIMQYVEKYRNLYLINIGLLCSVATFIGYAMFPYLPVVLLFQFLLAFSFSTLQVGAVQELLGKNLEQSTAMSLLNSIANFTAVLGPFMAGATAEYYGYSGVMWLGAIFSFIGLVSFTSVLE